MKILRLLITAGPTIEPIDPIRFISNRSTGYMGYELARLSKKRGFKTTLISGPTSLKPPPGIKFFQVETAQELYKKVHEELKKTDVLIMASAVSDFRPAAFSRDKIKPQKSLILRFVKNPDILGSISNRERKNKIIVGFSLETKNSLENAAKKLKFKNLDLIIANEIGRYNIPFGRGAMTVYLLDRYGHRRKLEKATKAQIASAILDTIEELCYTRN